MLFHQAFNESITSVCGGLVGSSSSEVLVSTYSGQIYGLCKDTGHKTQTISSEVQEKLDVLKYVKK